MADLKALYENLGYKDVQTYLQSGNVIFSASSNAGEHGRKLSTAIKAEMGHDVPVIVFSAAAFTKIATMKPLFRGMTDEAFLYVTFLDSSPQMDFSKCPLPKVNGEDAVLKGGHIYLHCPHGYGRTKLNNNYFERILKTRATTRNWKTVQALYRMIQK